MNTTHAARRRSRIVRLVVAFLALALFTANLQAPASAKGKKGKGDVDVVVKFKFGADPDAVARELGYPVVEAVIENRRIYLLDVNAKDSKEADEIAQNLQRHGRVDWAEPEMTGKSAEAERFRAWPSETPPVSANQAGYRNQPAIHDAIAGVHGTATGAGVRVAVLDTGIDRRHPALKDHIKWRLDLIDGDWTPDDVGNGVDDDGDGFVDESVGHGTHVAGIIRLIAPDAEILAYRVLDSDGQGSVIAVAEAIRHAVDQDADVINVSFGTDKDQKSRLLREALQYARDNNVAIVAAAGNDSDDKQRYPASDSRIISVAAYDPNASLLAPFATHGKWIDVAAPGVDIVSSIPGGGYASWSGSSMAAPFVAGQLALLVEATDGARVDRLIHHVTESTEKLDDECNKGNGKGKKKGKKGKCGIGKGLVKIRDSVDRT